MRALAAIALLFASPSSAQVFDLHVHLHKGAESLRAYEQAAAGQGVAAFGAMWFGGPNQALAGNPDAIRAGNDGILALAGTNPKLLPIVTVHPYDGEAALAELQRVAARGAKVLKIHPHTQKFDAADPRVLTLVQRAGDLGIVVMFDNAAIVPGDCEKLFNLALAAPKTKFVFAHIGGLNFRFWNILKLARTAENLFANNIFFDVSGLVILAADSPIEQEFVWTLRNVGIDQLILGSDYPQLSIKETLAGLDRLGLSEPEKEKIRWKNASALLGLAR